MLDKPLKNIARLKAMAAILITVVLWASAFAGIRAALTSYSPTHLALLRYIVAALVLAGYGLAKGMRLPVLRDLPSLFLLGFLGIAVYNVALNYGEQTVSAGAASFIVNTVPVFTAILSFVFLNERIALWGWIGIVVGFCGAAIISLGEAGSGDMMLNKGAGFILLAAFVQAIYFVAQKTMLQRYSPLELTTYAIWAGMICLLVFFPGLWEAILDSDSEATYAVVYLGIGPGALGYLTYTYALANMKAAEAANYLFLVPVVTLPIAWFWLAEVPGLLAVVGGLVVLSGVLLMVKKGRS